MNFRTVSIVLGSVFLTGVGIAQTAPPKVSTPDVPQIQPPTVETVSPKSPLDHPLTEAEAIHFALANQPLVKQAQAKVAQLHGSTRAARGSLLPQLTANASGTQNSNPSFGGSAGRGWNTSAAISLAQLLFDFGKSRAGLSQAVFLELVAIQQLRQVQIETTRSVSLAYIAFQQARQVEEYSAGNVANRSRQLALVTARLNEGVGPPSDVVQAKASLASATISFSNAQANVALARSAFALALGIDARTLVDVEPLNLTAPPEDAYPDAAAEPLVSEAMANRPEILASKAQVQAAKSAVYAARAGGAPAIFLTSSVASRGSGRAFTSENSTLGLSLSWSIFDGGSRAGLVQSAQAQVAQSEQALAATGLQVTSDVYQALVNRATAMQNLKLASVQVANAAEFLRIAEGRYRGGIGLFTDVVSASDTLFAAQTSYAQSLASLRSADANLRRALGRQ